jgi:hypothetical protein
VITVDEESRNVGAGVTVEHIELTAWSEVLSEAISHLVT